jgi:YD repeat-containing protein
VSKSGNAADGSAIPSDGLPSATYNSASNRVTNAGFQYDYAGNQTQSVDIGSVIKQYRYDTAGRLAQVLDSAGTVLATYVYGANNQRLRMQEGGEDTFFAWAGGSIIAEYTAAGSSGLTWSKSYVYLGRRLLATNTTNGTQFQHPDRLGTRLITAAFDGSVISEQVGLPFGTSLPDSSTLNVGEGYQGCDFPLMYF